MYFLWSPVKYMACSLYAWPGESELESRPAIGSALNKMAAYQIDDENEW